MRKTRPTVAGSHQTRIQMIRGGRMADVTTMLQVKLVDDAGEIVGVRHLLGFWQSPGDFKTQAFADYVYDR